MPGMSCKINPENSDFPVGNFLTKKAASCWEAAFFHFHQCNLCLFVIFQVNIYSLFLDVDILFNKFIYVDIMLNNGLQGG